MVGSMQSIAQANFTLNTIVAESLCQFADRLEKSKNIQKELKTIILEVIKDHKRIIFNGNNYSDEWVAESTSRGLPNIRNTVDAIAAIRAEKNLALMEKHGVLSRVEMESRCEIQYETYIKTVNIEGLTMAEMSKRQILPAVIRYKTDLASSINSILAAGGNAEVEKTLFTKISESTVAFSINLAKLEKELETAAHLHGNTKAQAVAYRDTVFKTMGELRKDADTLETIVAADYWPIPTYSKLLFNI
jgi:glutamine synthetase